MTVSENSALSATTILNDPRWRAVEARDSKADGTFVYAVRTTGIYCRPSCPARRPRPENISFHTSCDDAERLGFRACHRCKPDQLSVREKHVTQVNKACRILETAEPQPNLSTLATAVGLSPHYFHRVFKQLTGVTPRQYAAQLRQNRLHNELGHQTSITDAMLAAGYNTSSRFYEQSNEVLGMTPSHYRAGGRNRVIHFAVGECSLGSILVAQSEKGVCAILLGDEPDVLVIDLQQRFPHAQLLGGDANFEKIVATVVGFVEAPTAGFDLPLDVRGTAFQQRVWQALRQIPPGKTAHYTEVAALIGAPDAVRAVAGACAANPLAVAIPCHRVVRKDGGLSGYRWGVERKRVLLERERGER